MYDELQGLAARGDHQHQLQQAEQILRAIRGSDALAPRRRWSWITGWRASTRGRGPARAPLNLDPLARPTLREDH